jgi:membrane-bound serine protease (ClpP class)
LRLREIGLHAVREAYDSFMTALGVSLLLVGAVAILVEAHVSSLGILGAPGVILVAVGSVLAVGGLGGGILLGVVLGLLLAAIGAAAVVVSLKKGMAVRRRRVSTGREGLIGHVGVVRSWTNASGSVLVDGALWRASPSWPGEEYPSLHNGDAVVVERVSGLTLGVRPAEDWELVR